MNRQEVFNRVAAHLLAQGEQSVSEDGSCMYRAPNGRACAIGCLITDDAYTSNLESNGAKSVAILSALARSGVLENTYNVAYEDAELLAKLQHLHDGRDPETWLYELQLLADNNGLEFNA